MQRWNFDDDEENAERFFDDGADAEEGVQYISEEDYQQMISKANEIQEAQLQLIEMQNNQRLLAETISMLKNSWFWPFKSAKAKLKEIGMAYKYLQRITEDNS